MEILIEKRTDCYQDIRHYKYIFNHNCTFREMQYLHLMIDNGILYSGV